MKYRKLPVIIEAFQMTKEKRWDNKDWPNWLNKAWNGNIGVEGTMFCSEQLPNEDLFIITLEGTQKISWGDYIIQGIKGEIYPCKPDIFEKTYDIVND